MALPLDPSLFMNAGIGKTRNLTEDDLHLEDSLQDPTQVAMPETAPQAAPMPAAIPKSQFPTLAGVEYNPSDDYSKALEDARKTEQMNNLLKAGNQIAVGAAGYSGAKPDMTGTNEVLDAVTNNAKGKAADFVSKQKFGQEQTQGAQLKSKLKKDSDDLDPNSEASMSMRKMYETQFPNIAKAYGPLWERVAAGDADKILKPMELGEQIAARRQNLQLSLDNKRDIAREKAEAANSMSAGVKKLDQEFAKDYNDWTSGGRAALDKNIERLQSSKKALESGAVSSGRFIGRLPDILKPEDRIRVRDDVHAAAVAGMRAALGAQFTEKEGERIQGYAFNEKLSPEENIKKIDAAIKELTEAKANKDAKALQFQQKGTLAGYTPKISVDSAQDATKIVNGVTYKKVQGGWQKVK
jgi:hypothetical protein